MRQYEAVTIFAPQFAGDKLELAQKSFEELVKKSGGSVGGRHEMGKRHFGYVIRKHKEGFYIVFDFKLDPAKVTELKKAITLTDSILRCSILIKQEFPKHQPVPAAAGAPPSHNPAQKPISKGRV